jgi:hypothetical protein
MSQHLYDPAPPAYVPQTPSDATQCNPKIPILASLRWLRLGWQDLRTQVVNSLFYGVAFWGMAMVLGLVFRNSPEYTMTPVSSSVLIALS